MAPDLTNRSGSRYALLLFLAAHTLLSVDRSIMAILLEPIRNEFHLSDTQLGLLTGIGFAFFFGVAGLPLGRMVDHWNRRNILAASVGLFSIMTSLAAATVSFGQLLVTRLIVGAGEAGGSPAMLSMIADLYPPKKRASAVALYYAGGPIGGMLIFLTGGWAATHYGWRAVFLGAGTPGILLALLLLTIREPRRIIERSGAASQEAVPFRAALRFILSQPSLRHLLATPAITTAATGGLFSFAVSFLVRSHGATLTQAGLLMSVAYGAVGIAATIGSGLLVDRLARRDERWRSWFCMICCTLTFPAVAVMIFAPSLLGATIGLALWAAASTGTYGPLMALLQSLVGTRMRGTVSAIFYFLSYFVGISLGPQIIGLMSDLFGASRGTDGLRYAMLVAASLYLWAAVHFALSARSLRHDFERAAAH